MLARFVLGAVTAGAMIAPALAGQMMNAEEARRFVAGKVFAFTCFDGTRGAGRVFEDGGAAGAVQFSGSGPVRHMRLPGNTLQVRGQSVCASIKGLPLEPCFNLDKQNERNSPFSRTRCPHKPCIAPGVYLTMAATVRPAASVEAVAGPRVRRSQ
jgi:hypothetical protein